MREELEQLKRSYTYLFDLTQEQMIVINAQRNEFLSHLEEIEKYNKEYDGYIREYICRSRFDPSSMTRISPSVPVFNSKYNKREPYIHQKIHMPGSQWVKVIEPILGTVRVKTTKEEKVYNEGKLHYGYFPGGNIPPLS
jgi:hypothetical protein